LHVIVRAVTTRYSTRCRIWPSEGAASATVTRHVAACRHAAPDDLVASVDTIRSAQTVRGAGRSITTDRGRERLRHEQINVSVSHSTLCRLFTFTYEKTSKAVTCRPTCMRPSFWLPRVTALCPVCS